MIEKYHLDAFYSIIKFKPHNDIKNHLLRLIHNQFSETVSRETVGVDENSIWFDNISKLDWLKSRNFEREWVKFFLPKLDQYLNSFSDYFGYSGYRIYDIWFQQYIKNDRHGWHIHGNNFTGVYYLELPEVAPKTELMMPYNHDVVVPSVNEGDILIIPSFTIHRAPLLQNSERKTIISWNFDVDHIRDDIKMINWQSIT